MDHKKCDFFSYADSGAGNMPVSEYILKYGYIDHCYFRHCHINRIDQC